MSTSALPENRRQSFLQILRLFLLENPVLIKELRTRMRGTRAFWVLFAYLLILSLMVFFPYLVWWRSQQGGYGNTGAFNVGKQFFAILSIVQGLLVAVITPALTAGGISIEKEQRTMDLLTISLLPRAAVVLGKLLSALSFVLLLLLSSLPLVSVTFLLGGVSPAEVISSSGLLLVIAFVYGAAGIACSSVAKNTTAATVMTYGTIAGFFFVTLRLLFAANFFSGSSPNYGNMTAINPMGAMGGGVTMEKYYDFLTIPSWLTSLVVNGLLGSILTLVAIHRIDWPRSDRSGTLRWLTGVFVLILAILLYGMYLPGVLTGSGITDCQAVGLLTLCGIAVLIPLFTTSENLPTTNVFAAFLDPRRLHRGESPSGIAYVLLLSVLCSGLMFGGLLFGPTGKVAQHQATVLGIGLLLVAVAFGSGGIGVFVSALTRNRWSAMVLSASFLLLTCLIPSTMIAGREASSPASALDNIVYLSPIVAMQDTASLQPGEPADRKAIPPGSLWSHLDSRVLLAGGRPLSFVTIPLYLLLGIASLLGAEQLRTRQGRGDRNKS